MVAWDRVTRADVLRAIKECDRLGRSDSSPSMVSPRPPLMNSTGKSAVTRRKRFWAQRMNSPPASASPPVTSRAVRQAPSGCSESWDSRSSRSGDPPSRLTPLDRPRRLAGDVVAHPIPRRLNEDPRTGADFRLFEVNRRLPLPDRPDALGGRRSVERLGNGQAIGRDVDGTVSRTRQRSRSRLGSQYVQPPRRWIREETQPPPSGVRSDNGAWAGRRAW